MIKNKEIDEQMKQELYRAILACKTEEDIKKFLEDLCTFKEVDQMAQRVRAAKRLMEGKTYTDIIDETNISSATLSRVSRTIQYGNGTYQKNVEK